MSIPQKVFAVCVVILALGVLVPLSICASLPWLLWQRDSTVLKTSGFIDKSGNFAFHHLNTLDSAPFSNGLWLAHDRFLDKQGMPICELEFMSAENFSDGLAAVCEYRKQWGFIDTQGKYVIPPRLHFASSFQEGVALCKQNGLWGFLNKTGDWVIPPKFHAALPFSDGLAAVEVGGKLGFIDHRGQLVIPPQYDIVKSFSEGLAIVTTFETTKELHHTRCIDKSGKVVFDVTDMLTKIRTGDKNRDTGAVSFWGQPDVLCSNGEDKAHCPSLSRAPDPERFCEGLSRIKCNGKFGYVDKRGNVVIPCKFWSAERFREGLALVSLPLPDKYPDGRRLYGYIDKSGNYVIQPKWTIAHDFSEGLAGVCDEHGQGGFIDHYGNIVIPIPGGHAGEFHEGLGSVGENIYYP